MLERPWPGTESGGMPWPLSSISADKVAGVKVRARLRWVPDEWRMAFRMPASFEIRRHSSPLFCFGHRAIL